MDESRITLTGDWALCSIRQPKRVEWKPQEDVTPYELALCLPVLIFISNGGMVFYPEDCISGLPQAAQRHFLIATPDTGRGG